MPEIDAATNNKIRVLCGQGDKLSKLGDYDRAVSKYYEALTLLPSMHGRDQISAFLFTSIGEAYWNMKDFENAGKSFCEAYECPGMNENAQITLRIGQCLTECGDETNARDYLRHAVRLGGESIIADVDRRYYNVLYPAAEQINVQPQPSGDGLYASGISRGSSPAASSAGRSTFSLDPSARADDTATDDTAAQADDAQAFELPVQPSADSPAETNGMPAAASAQKGSDKLSGSAFGFITEAFRQSPGAARAGTEFVDYRADNDSADSNAAFDPFAAVSGAAAEAKPSDSAEASSSDKPKPEKQGFFSRLFGGRK